MRQRTPGVRMQRGTRRVAPLAWLAAAVAAVGLVLGACETAETPGPTFGAADEGDVPPSGPGEASEPVTDVTIRTVEGTELQPSDVSAEAGEIVIGYENVTTDTHVLTIEGFEEQFQLRAEPGEFLQGTITLEPGTYRYYCEVAGHAAGGEQGTLTVE